MATLTPSHTFESPRDPRNAWEFAVPLDGDENNANNYDRSSKTPMPSQPNGKALRSRSSNLGDDRESTDGHKPRSNSSTRAKRVVRKKSSQTTSLSKSPDQDESNWIHRDKLAQIESKELEEFSIRLNRRISERRDQSPDKSDQRQRLASPTAMDETAEVEEYDDEGFSTSPKSYMAQSGSRTPGGNSRIPLPRSLSGTIAPGDMPNNVNRTRSRTNSIGMSHSPEQSSDNSQTARKQSNPEYNEDLQPSSPDSPPRMSNNAANASSTSVQNQSPHKKSAPKNKKANGRTPTTQRQGTRPTPSPISTTAEPKRPGTSSGRPGTSHAPEGDPPWMVNSYKPDPRLPPDQQMLPTHAKRLAQQQWEKEGKTGTAYDREFRLLNDTPLPDRAPSEKHPSPLPSPSLRSGQPSPGLPSPSLAPPSQYRSSLRSMEHTLPGMTRSNTSSPRPGTSDTHGGYRTMPSIARTPTPLNQEQEQHVPQPAIGAVSVQPMPMDGFEDDDEAVDKKKGCMACCVVM